MSCGGDMQAPGASGSGRLAVYKTGLPIALTRVLNFIGAGVSVVWNDTECRADVTIPGGSGSFSVAWADITGKPTAFTPDTHVHPSTEVTGLGTAAVKNVGTTGDDVAAGNHTHTQYLPFTGGTLLGALVLASDPSIALHPATKQYVDAAIAGILDTPPGTLDTLNELAAALGDDPNFATTMTTLIGQKLASSQNLADLANAATARTNLGLGDAAVKNVGTGASDVAAGDHLHDARYLQLTGGTLLGALLLAADPTLNLHAATKQYVDARVAAIVNSAPGTLDTLNELAAALNNDPAFATTLTTLIGQKLAIAQNLADLTDAAAARTNLGLGDVATRNVGTTAGTAAAGDHVHNEGEIVRTRTLFVDPNGYGDYTTIKAACDYIIAQSPTIYNNWIIAVAPGRYVQTEVWTLPAETTIVGLGSPNNGARIDWTALPAGFTAGAFVTFGVRSALRGLFFNIAIGSGGNTITGDVVGFTSNQYAWMLDCVVTFGVSNQATGNQIAVQSTQHEFTIYDTHISHIGNTLSGTASLADSTSNAGVNGRFSMRGVTLSADAANIRGLSHAGTNTSYLRNVSFGGAQDCAPDLYISGGTVVTYNCDVKTVTLAGGTHTNKGWLRTKSIATADFQNGVIGYDSTVGALSYKRPDGTLVNLEQKFGAYVTVDAANADSTAYSSTYVSAPNSVPTGILTLAEGSGTYVIDFRNWTGTAPFNIRHVQLPAATAGARVTLVFIGDNGDQDWMLNMLGFANVPEVNGKLELAYDTAMMAGELWGVVECLGTADGWVATWGNNARLSL